MLFAESTALRGRKMTMISLSQKLDQLLETNEYPVFREYKDYLRDRAINHAKAEYAVYRKRLAAGVPDKQLQDR